MVGEIVQWREARGNSGWSDTLYKGLMIRDGVGNGHFLLVAKLSHGWRVMEVADATKVQFAMVPVVNVELPRLLDFYIRQFLAEDQLFQDKAGAVLDKLMTGE